MTPRFLPRRSSRQGTVRYGTGSRTHHGVAILARGSAPIEIRRGLPHDESDLQARYLEAEVTRTPDRFGLPTQRQPATRAQIRLQAGMDRAIDSACSNVDGFRPRSRAGGRLQRGSDQR